MSTEPTMISFQADPETQRLLKRMQDAEGRNRSDLIRRSVRLYAEAAGLARPKAKPKPVKVSTPKPRPRKVAKGKRS